MSMCFLRHNVATLVGRQQTSNATRAPKTATEQSRLFVDKENALAGISTKEKCIKSIANGAAKFGQHVDICTDQGHFAAVWS